MKRPTLGDQFPQLEALRTHTSRKADRRQRPDRNARRCEDPAPKVTPGWPVIVDRRGLELLAKIGGKRR